MNYLGFKKEEIKPVVNELNKLLSNYHIYYQNLRNFHWNIKGENFFDLHNQFEDLYNDARLKIDEVAERILTLRHQPISRFSEYLEVGNIPEAPMLDKDREMVLTILENHQTLIKNLRAVIESAGKVNDEGTIDMGGTFLENLEKKSWMLDAWAARSGKPVEA